MTILFGFLEMERANASSYYSRYQYQRNTLVNGHRPGVKGTREIANTDYSWVGQLYFKNSASCTAWFVAPGMLATAKHCFTHGSVPTDARWGHITVHFTKTDRISQRGYRKVVRITEVVWDEGENDIAFLRYEPNELDGFFDVKITLATQLPDDLTSLIVVGFPMLPEGNMNYQIESDYVRVIAKECAALRFAAATQQF